MQQTQLTTNADIASSSSTIDIDNRAEGEALRPTAIIKGYTPDTLVDYLLKHRFNGDISKCETFFSECTTICKNRNSSIPEKEIDMGDKLHAQEGIQFIAPRGKFHMSIYTKGIILQNSKGEKIFIGKNNINSIVSFPKPEDLMLKKKASNCTYYKMITLSSSSDASSVTFKNKEIGFVCFAQFSQENVFDSFDISQENCIDITQSSDYYYKSENSTYPNMPFIQCYSGVSLGALFPHPKGLLFFKPPNFIPRQYLNSIQCGRGTGNTRYIDLTIDVEQYPNAKQYGEMQFTNIPREELKPLKLFIANLVAEDDETTPTKQEFSATIEEGQGETTTSSSTNGKRALRNASVNASKRTKKDIVSGRHKQDNNDNDSSDEDDNDSSDEDDDDDFKMENSSGDDDDDDSDTSLDDEDFDEQEEDGGKSDSDTESDGNDDE